MARRKKIPTEAELTIKLLEVLVAVQLYQTTTLTRQQVARKLGIDDHRMTAILAGIKKPNKS